MTVEDCPRCRTRHLSVVNVMGTTKTIMLRCSRCNYKEDRSYLEQEMRRQTNAKKVEETAKAWW